MKNNWTRDETMLAFELYCTMPKGKDTVYNPKIIALSRAIGRSTNSVKLKLQNFKSCDPSYTQDGKVGLSNASKLDWEVCNEFFQNWDNLIVETNEIKTRLGLHQPVQIDFDDMETPIGKDKIIISKVREGQAFFRAALMAAYDNKCCFTGIDIPELLRASHIKPWSKSNDINEKTNPRNGLLLNALHDAAFDRGYITITFDYTIVIASELLLSNAAHKTYFELINGRRMLLPSRFLPDKKFIEYHHKMFKGKIPV